MKYNWIFKKSILVIALSAGITSAGTAQDNLKYQLPPQSIVDLVDVPETPIAIFSKNGHLALLVQAEGFTSIKQVAQPVIGVAGIKLNPANNSTEAEVSGLYINLVLKDVKTGKDLKISGMPAEMRIGNIEWNTTGTHFAFSNKTLTGVELWVADVANLKATRLTQGLLSDAFGDTLLWSPDNKNILAKFIPANRGPKPVLDIVPKGPIVQENLGVVTPSRTYQYLLQNEFDEVLMDYYLTAQLKLVNVDGSSTDVGTPAIYRSTKYSPDGNYLLAQIVKRPYSYLVPINSFPFQTAVLDAKGNLVKELAMMGTGFDGATAGKRGHAWRADAPAMVTFTETTGKDKTEKTSLYLLNAPFTAEAKKIFTTSEGQKLGGVNWANDKYAVVSENNRKERTEKTFIINPETGAVVKEMAKRSSENTYTDPGRFIQNPNGTLLLDKGNQPIVFTIGGGASALGDRPFLMKWNLITNKQDTLFKSKAPYFETPVFYNNSGNIYISRESASIPANYIVLNTKTKKEQKLTEYGDPYPSLKGVEKKLLSYPRKDGLKLSAVLYLPKGYKKEDGPLPALVWAYPREFKTAEAAGQVKGSPYRFTRLAFRSPVYWVTKGYAILDQADMPIVGEGKTEPNDTFIEQITMNAEALVNYVADMGVVDRNRIGVGGHSYGAFMTSHLLAHTKLFAAGIARSGAYNRTLTPFGFQGETRTYWQAPELYNKMSPFIYADKIKLPLLITHGSIDDNSGTFPIQSERFYSAIKGHGGTVRLVMLPNEFHGYRSRESVLHTFWEQDRWLDQYVKNKKEDKK